MKGFLIMILWIVAWWLLISKCTGAPVTVTWTKNAEPDIAGYRVYVNGTEAGTTNATRLTIDAKTGDSVTVSAFNAFLEGPQSAPSVVKDAPKMVKVRLWRSTNLIDKTLVGEFYFDRKEREFFSLTIETP